MHTPYRPKRLNAQQLREATEIGRDGVNMLGMAQAAEKMGFRTKGVKVSLENLVGKAHLPETIFRRKCLN